MALPFSLLSLLTSWLWQGVPDLLPPLRWLAVLIIIIFCPPDTVALLSWLLLFSPNFCPWLDVAQKLCHLLCAWLPSFYKLPFPPKHVKVFSIPDTSCSPVPFAFSSLVHVYSLTAWRLTSSLDWTVTEQHTYYACVVYVWFSRCVYVFSFPYCGRALLSILLDSRRWSTNPVIRNLPLEQWELTRPYSHEGWGRQDALKFELRGFPPKLNCISLTFDFRSLCCVMGQWVEYPVSLLLTPASHGIGTLGSCPMRTNHHYMV